MSLSPAAIQRLRVSIEGEVESDLYDGAVVLVARHGEVGIHEAIGFADRSAARALRPDDLFWIFSTTKAFTNVLVLAAIDRGLLSPITKVVDVIPEFAGRDRFRTGLKGRVNVAHLMTHRAATSPTPWPLPYDQVKDLGRTIEAICEMDLVGVPGEKVNYSPCLCHALLGEIARRTLGAGRSFKAMLQEELLDPLKMSDTFLGTPSGLADRLVPVVAKFRPGGFFTPKDIEDTAAAASEGAELPWVGCLSTTGDMFRFAEMLRRGGELDGVRILSPAVLDMATTNQTGALLNDRYAKLVAEMHWDTWVANIGLGFMLRGQGLYQTFFGSTASPRTFGNYGAGSSQFWIEPERDLTFVCLTSGVLGEADNLRRFERLSDMAIAAAI